MNTSKGAPLRRNRIEYLKKNYDGNGKDNVNVTNKNHYWLNEKNIIVLHMRYTFWCNIFGRGHEVDYNATKSSKCRVLFYSLALSRENHFGYFFPRLTLQARFYVFKGVHTHRSHKSSDFPKIEL